MHFILYYDLKLGSDLHTPSKSCHWVWTSNSARSHWRYLRCEVTAKSVSELGCIRKFFIATHYSSRNELYLSDNSSDHHSIGTYVRTRVLDYLKQKIIYSLERERFVIPLIYAFIGCFWHVLWPGIEPTTLAYQDDTLTNWATQPGLELSIICVKGQMYTEMHKPSS